MTDTFTNVTNQSQDRVKLILVDEIPDNLLASCLPNANALFNEYDQDVVRGMHERNLVYKLSDKSVVYTKPLTDVPNIYFKDITQVNSPELLLVLAKYPNAQVVFFLTKNSENNINSNPFLSVYETNYDELNIENWRKPTVSLKPAPIINNTVLDAKSIIEKFKNEINKIL